MSARLHVRSMRNAAQSRQAILQAARREFGERGVDGARTDSIARAAGVNKALLYYYFRDKESLYGAVLDDVFAGRFQGLKSILESDMAPGEKLLRFARQHFDYVSGPDSYPQLVQYEMMRAASGHSKHLPRLIKSFFQPMMHEVSELIRQGIAARQIRRVDPAHVVLSIIGVNVFHMISSPITRHLKELKADTLESIARRRAATLDFVAASIFADREEGIRLAAKIGAEPLTATNQSASLRRRAISMHSRARSTDAGSPRERHAGPVRGKRK